MKIISSLILAIALTAAFLTGYFFPKKIANSPVNTLHSSPMGSRVFNANSALPDFSVYNDVKQKKADFFAYMLPRIQKANQLISKERKWLKDLLSQDNQFEQSQVNQLLALSDKYKVKVLNPNDMVAELLVRIDSIPASLVLAQAANESAWGTSRFAKQGNNLFGQWCYVKGCGMIPKSRGNNQHHEVASFDNIQQSINSYMRNLNSQSSYKDLRVLRKKMRDSSQSLSGLALAHGLLKYSTRREAYVEEIQAMIRQNKLSQYD